MEDEERTVSRASTVAAAGTLIVVTQLMAVAVAALALAVGALVLVARAFWRLSWSLKLIYITTVGALIGFGLYSEGTEAARYDKRDEFIRNAAPALYTYFADMPEATLHAHSSPPLPEAQRFFEFESSAPRGFFGWIAVPLPDVAAQRVGKSGQGCYGVDVTAVAGMPERYPPPYRVSYQAYKTIGGSTANFILCPVGGGSNSLLTHDSALLEDASSFTAAFLRQVNR